MREIGMRLWREPAVCTGVATAVLSAAATQYHWLGWVAAAVAAAGAVFTRQRVEVRP